MHGVPSLRKATASSATASRESFPPDRVHDRCDADTSTDDLRRGGAELQYHLRSLPSQHLFLLLSTPVLCFLNGCSYFLFWRFRLLEEAAEQSTLLTTADTSATMLAAGVSVTAPGAMYGVAAGVAFAFILSQWVIQESARALICAESDRERAASLRRCGLLFEVAFLPLILSEIVLMGHNYHLRRENQWENSQISAGVVDFASKQYDALWIVSFLLTTVAMVVVAAVMWTDAAVAWLQSRVFAAHLAAKIVKQA